MVRCGRVRYGTLLYCTECSARFTRLRSTSRICRVSDAARCCVRVWMKMRSYTKKGQPLCSSSFAHSSPFSVFSLTSPFLSQMEEGGAATHSTLSRSKEQRVPRLQDLTMRPTLVKKTVGELEAHSNGLRFSSPNLVRDGWREKEREKRRRRIPYFYYCTRVFFFS